MPSKSRAVTTIETSSLARPATTRSSESPVDTVDPSIAGHTTTHRSRSRNAQLPISAGTTGGSQTDEREDSPAQLLPHSSVVPQDRLSPALSSISGTAEVEPRADKKKRIEHIASTTPHIEVYGQDRCASCIKSNFRCLIRDEFVSSTTGATNPTIKGTKMSCLVCSKNCSFQDTAVRGLDALRLTIKDLEDLIENLGVELPVDRGGDGVEGNQPVCLQGYLQSLSDFYASLISSLEAVNETEKGE